MRQIRTLTVAALLALAPSAAWAQDAPSVATGPGNDRVATEAPGTEPTAEPAVPLTVTPPDGRPAMPSVASLFTGLRDDLRGVATTDNAVIVVTAGGAAALIHPYDASLTETFSTSPTLATVLGPGKVIGGFAVQFGGAWVAYGLGRAFDNPRAAMVGADLVRAQLVNTIFTQGLKLSINRTRPDGDNWSFPSGHASGTFANAAVLHRHFGWKVGAPAYAVATYVAASRLQANRHFASDVIFGAGIGLISGRAVTIGRGGQRYAIGPMPVPGGGAGISFTRID
jgi:membrane-associated phospholipid phosphatase